MSKVSSRTYQVSRRMGLIFGVVVSRAKSYIPTCATEKWAALTKKRMITKRPLISPILTLMLGVKADQGPARQRTTMRHALFHHASN